ncbi:1-acyl-sn-glycerol-3-phosphate acyltransferase [bacterium]|nr:1-acyl-sn-glycerol-3-phosphate acyltransferase [bacterium]
MAKEERNYNRRYAREYNIFRTMFYYLMIFVLVKPYMDKYYNYTITGRENLPKHKKANKLIYAGNHVSELDPPILTFAVMRPIAYMAKKELFEKSEKRSWLVKRLGAFAVDRAKPEIATFKTVRDILKTHWSLGVFPQGGTKPYGKLNDLKKGFVVIAKKAEADIIPVAIDGWDGYPDKNQKKPIQKKDIRIHICKPISYKLDEDEIMYLWSKEISEHANYTEIMPKPEKMKTAEEAVTAG